MDGQLTTFSGIPFGADQPYTYREAKRILGLAMADLRDRKVLRKELGADGAAPGRPAITGAQDDSVWDMIPLQAGDGGRDPRTLPHLTLSVGQHRALVLVIVPNTMDKACVRRLRNLTSEEFAAVLRAVAANLEPVLAHAPGASPRLRVLQRRFPSRRGSSIDDAVLDADLRTQIADSASRGTVRYQPQWLEAAFDVWCRKRSNMSFELAVQFPYDRCPAIRAPTAVDLFTDAWLACKPFLDTVRGG